jgi:uncharacterized protein (DUF427 family)
MNYPPSIARVNQTAPAPRRIRGVAGGRVVFDTTRALYVWEWPHYPQYYIARADVDEALLEASGAPHPIPQGTSQDHALRLGDDLRTHAAKLFTHSPLAGVADTYRFRWSALDHWYEEDEEVFVHPRDPYTRVDALRSRRRVRIELDGTVLAESPCPVAVFETGLPTRWYVDASDVRFEFLRASETRTECPYKGRTTGYWSVVVGDRTYADFAWSYAFPTRQLLPIAGSIAFLDEKVDVFLDGVAQPRPVTHMS